MSQQDERFSFIAEWYDENAALIRKYTFFLYPSDNTIEMYDIKNRRPFLKRCTSSVKLEDLFIGNSVNVFNRQLKFVEYADNYTRSRLSSQKERTLGLIKPDAVHKMGDILEQIQRNGFLIANLKMLRLSRNEAFDFYMEHQNKSFFNELVGFMTSGPVVAFELMGSDAVNQWRALLGPTDSSIARSQAPNSIRARFGTDNTKNACHGSDSTASAQREIEFFFPSGSAPRQNTATLNACTCCIIKPHAVLNGDAGRIINEIMNSHSFKIGAISMYKVEQANAEEFYEVYKGVVNEYKEMINELMSGPVIAMEIVATGPCEDVVSAFRDMVGPADPEIARHLKGHTLRAKYGFDKIRNAVHCTDLPEDGVLEVEYFFRILDSKR